MDVEEHVVVKGRRSAFSDGCGGFRQALGLAAASAHHLTITRMKPAPARCEPIPVFPLLPARTIAGIRAAWTFARVDKKNGS